MRNRNVFGNWKRQTFRQTSDSHGGFCAMGWINHVINPTYVGDIRNLVRFLLNGESIFMANDVKRRTPAWFRKLNVLVPADWFKSWKP